MRSSRVILRTGTMAFVSKRGTSWGGAQRAGYETTVVAGGSMRVLVTVPWGEPLGGAEAMLQAVLSGAQEAGHELELVFFRPGSWPEELKAAGFRVEVVPAGRLREAHRWVVTVVRLARIMRSRRPDLMLNWAAKTQLYGAPAAVLAGMGDRVVWWQQAIPRARWLDGCATHASRGRGRLLLPGVGASPGAAVPRAVARSSWPPALPCRRRAPQRVAAGASRRRAGGRSGRAACSRGRVRTGCCGRRPCSASGGRGCNRDRRRGRLRAVRRVRESLPALIRELGLDGRSR